MPRTGYEQNLIPMNKRSPEERKRIGLMGGKALGVANQRRKTMRELALAIGSQLAKDPKGNTILDENGDELTRDCVVMLKLYQNAQKGDVKSIKLLSEILGDLAVAADVEVQTNIVLKFD